MKSILAAAGPQKIAHGLREHQGDAEHAEVRCNVKEKVLQVFHGKRCRFAFALADAVEHREGLCNSLQNGECGKAVVGPDGIAEQGAQKYRPIHRQLRFF